jgi:hypothetical protein
MLRDTVVRYQRVNACETSLGLTWHTPEGVDLSPEKDGQEADKSEVLGGEHHDGWSIEVIDAIEREKSSKYEIDEPHRGRRVERCRGCRCR